MVEEVGYLAALHRPEGAGRGEVVDEEAVALVGRDAPCARVGLHQVSLAFERDHLRADGGGRDLHARRVGDVRGAHRLGRADVLADDGLQNGGAAALRSGSPAASAWGWCGSALGVMVGAWHSILPSASGSGLGAPGTGATPGLRVSTRPRFSQSSPSRRAEMKASWGTSTRPMFFMRFLPSFCFSSSLRLRVMSPP